MVVFPGVDEPIRPDFPVVDQPDPQKQECHKGDSLYSRFPKTSAIGGLPVSGHIHPHDMPTGWDPLRSSRVCMLWLGRPIKRLLTPDSAQDGRPQWSPSGAEVTFQSMRDGNYDIFHRAADGTGDEELLVGIEASERPYGWSRDGRYLLYTVPVEEEGANDIWYLKRKDGEDGFESAPFLQTSFNEVAPHLSPDGRFLAFSSNASGSLQVYVRSFPSGEEQWQVSINGGSQARWSNDGTELFYVEGDTLMAARVKTASTFDVVSTTALFSDPSLFSGEEGIIVLYDVAADGRFVLQDRVGIDDTAKSITIIENWYEEFRDRESPNE